MTTPEQLQEALEKAQRALSAIESGPWSDSPRIATDALSEIAAILNPPRYVVEDCVDGVAAGNPTVVRDLKSGQRLFNTYIQDGRQGKLNLEDAVTWAKHIARLLNQEEEKEMETEYGKNALSCAITNQDPPDATVH